MIQFSKPIVAGCLATLVLPLLCVGCSSKHPQTIQASPEQQKQWEDEEAAESKRKLDEARARGQVQ